MSQKKKILTVSGSTRQQSTNQLLITLIVELFSDELDFTSYAHLGELPQFNVDLDTAEPPALIADLRKQLKAADGVLICTPEYAMGLPGSLKNLLDWTVSSGDFSQKPVAVITASTSGEKAHESLLGTLRIIEAKVDEKAALVISHVKAKIKDRPEMSDEKTLAAVKDVMREFIKHLSF